MKGHLRKKLTQLRKKKYFELSSEQKFFLLNKIIKIANQLKKSKIGIYFPINYELNILSIFNTKQIKKLKFLLPCIKNKNTMSFKSWNLNEPMFINKFGILEPSKKNKILKPDILLVPLLGFDLNKNRLGYGRGFYDRFISNSLKSNKITTIGIAFSFQKIKKIHIEKHDQKLDFVLTEKELIQ